jgi:hypothetical protein
MGVLLDDPLYDRFATRALCHALYGGADFGECFVTTRRKSRCTGPGPASTRV